MTEWSTHPVVMPRVGLLANDSESLLRMNKTQEASSLDLGVDNFSIQVQLAFGHIFSTTGRQE